TGRSVLVGTTSVEKSELISGLLRERSIPHNLLNAKPENVEREAEIIAQAGRAGAVTISTNMAGRGTDIILGGNTDYMARLRIREALLPRLVNPKDPQLMGSELGKQRLNPVQAEALQRQQQQSRRLAKLFPCPLSTEVEQELKHLSDELADPQAWGEHRLSLITLDERLNVAAEKAPVQDPFIQRLRQLMQRIRGEYDKVTHREQEDVTNRGGLHVIGTERHESRRVDNQLRGRAGRQGDPGSSRFFLSLEDSLLRIFGGDRVAKVMDAFRVDEDMPIESGLLTRSLESAQKKVETYYFDIRKQVFDYDQVMNNQRRAIYAERHRVLKGDQLKQQVLSYGERTMEDIVDAYVDPEIPPEEWSLDRLAGKVKEFVHLLSELQPRDLLGLKIEELKVFLCEQLRSAYDIKEAQVNEIQPNLMRQAERFFILQQIDTLWREHLQSMDALRESVNLRGYGQKDPLMEYKNEGYTMFLEMMTQMRRNVIYSMFMFEPRPPAVSTPPHREVIV
ncbi:MAG: preprotein translocase subunit SecA, partial [Synechococcus sp. SB0663_bin_10]|nr:preprotein translocase subunit SecA [Synechococcus sp. SB0663_bin_10]